MPLIPAPGEAEADKSLSLRPARSPAWSPARATQRNTCFKQKGPWHFFFFLRKIKTLKLHLKEQTGKSTDSGQD